MQCGGHKAEAILAGRTSRILLVVECSYDLRNHLAVLRTAECLGLQHVWMVDPVEVKKAAGHKESKEVR